MSIAHLRCGSDIRDGLEQAGVAGRFIEYSDPVCQGPVPGGVDEAVLMDARAAFLSESYGAGTPAECRRRLVAERVAVDAIGGDDRTFLWFEHDIYDQSVLIRLLDIFAGRDDLDGRLSLIAIDRFPGIEPFIGLGQLSPDQLATLPAGAEPVSAEQMALGRRAWHAFRAADPTGLWILVDGGTENLPLLAPALRRHLMELPWTSDGLALTERLALRAIAEGARTPGHVFDRLARGGLEPQPFLGDLMFWPILRRLAAAGEPAVTPFDAWDSPIALTPFGEALLAGDADWCRANGIDRWVGGIRLAGSEPAWRWDAAGGRPIGAG